MLLLARMGWFTLQRCLQNSGLREADSPPFYCPGGPQGCAPLSRFSLHVHTEAQGACAREATARSTWRQQDPTADKLRNKKAFVPYLHKDV